MSFVDHGMERVLSRELAQLKGAKGRASAEVVPGQFLGTVWPEPFWVKKWDVVLSGLKPWGSQASEMVYKVEYTGSGRCFGICITHICF